MKKYKFKKNEEYKKTLGQFQKNQHPDHRDAKRRKGRIRN